jgi:hypothetical protein
MIYAAYETDFAHCVADKAVARGSAVRRKPGILARIADAILGWRQREEDREIGRFLAGSGGRLTDDLERRMMERLSTSNWSGRD